ncbi:MULTISPECIES: GNAT family N-acetyltransferase [Aeromonas]|uniref:GNAT family N-acetyltransferase n=1 Tax=Aeromonas TaxID=642 RepID=UPI00191E6608|nr:MULTISPECIES: GNAT family N-acetyltransferase [Aeromonas]MBL0526108.1 GNAT family N-acetyltransferase [Aeromonas dhakensis]MDX7832834.1 GNAT family N-acetyltransferase [Aeromonas dhakensis]QXC07406.1 GNAT family N-acetyltransferase [Aeromonas sp. FDAARGOS 1408]
MQLTTLANTQIVIRPFKQSDADDFVRAAHESIDTVGRWMSWCTPSFNREQALAWFATCDQDRAAGRAFDMGMFCAATGQLLGGAGINQLAPHHRYGNIGYWVRQSRQGQGIARQAVILLRDFGFERLGLFRLEIVMGVGNIASEAVAIAAGATFECRARNRIFLHGLPLDAHIYALVHAK